MPDEPELIAYLKVNVSPDFPSLVREASVAGGFANSSDWVRARLIACLVDELGADGDDLAKRQPQWGPGRGATDPEFIARRYGKPWPPESAESDSKSGEKVSQGG